MTTLLDLYKDRCKYPITDSIQELDYSIDIARLKKEIFDFIIKNNFGFSPISLRLPENNTDWTGYHESVKTTGISVYEHLIEGTRSDLVNSTHNKEYLNWHPDMENSYVKDLVTQLEDFTGFSIGRVRLNWLQPGEGYPMHWDLEPMRLHIPLITNTLSYFVEPGKIYHMEQGKLYHLIASDIHTVQNFGRLPRLHLMFSTYSDEIVDQELDKITNVELLKKNFADHAVNGVDQQSFTFLFKLLNSLSDRDDKGRIIYEMKKLGELLSINK